MVPYGVAKLFYASRTLRVDNLFQVEARDETALEKNLKAYMVEHESIINKAVQDFDKDGMTRKGRYGRLPKVFL